LEMAIELCDKFAELHHCNILPDTHPGPRAELCVIS
jgi:hypothetical protein